jgi:uncharacterized protein (TIGR02996 family)
MRGSKGSYAIACLLVLAGIVLAYSNSFHDGFHFDDFHTIVDNPAIRSLHNVPRFFTDANTFSVLPSNRTYRPLVSASLALDYALSRGYQPLWFHLSTFLLFLCLLVLLNRLFRLVLDKAQLSRSNRWLALFATAWFGLHPAMAETIDYVIQRGDLYCTLGCVAALLLYARYPRLRRSGLYLVPYALAMLSKPTAAVFPLLLIVYVVFFEAPEGLCSQRLRRGVVASIPAMALTALMLWLHAAMTPSSFVPSILSPWDYRLTQPFVWLRYTAELFLPLHLNVDSDLVPFHGLSSRALAGLAFIAGLVVAIWLGVRRQRLYPIAFGLLWFVITQLPTSLYPLSEVENDHRMFFSFPGLVLAVVWAIWLLLSRHFGTARLDKLRPWLLGAAVVLLCLYGIGVHARNAVWRDEESLWRDDVQKSPHNGRGLMNYGLTQMNKGDYATALDCFTRALIYTPDYPTLEINLGIVYGAMADRGDAQRAAMAEHHFLRAITLAPHDDAAHAYYGRWLDQQGRTAEAIAQLQIAVALDPQRPLQRQLLLQAELHAGDAEGARQVALDTLATLPDDAMSLQVLQHPPGQDSAYWINLSLAQYREQRYEQSIDSARKALAISPNSAEAYNNIGAAYGAMEQWNKAIDNDLQAVRLNPNLQIARNNLAWAQSHEALAKSRR